jgi:hypothetical protein
MTTATATKRTTMATVKSFIRKNRERLLVKTESRFSGMSDMVEETGNSEFVAIRPRTYYCRETFREIEVSHDEPSSLGIHGVWFVRGGGDSCRPFESETHKGFYVYNCCGSWTVAVAK